jgi:hypothetical protein
MKGPRETVEVVKAKCGDDAGMLGAAYSALIEIADCRLKKSKI